MINKKKVTAFIILILLLPILIILQNAYTIGLEESFYHNEFKKVGTYERVSNADIILTNIFNFFNNKEELNYFSEKETQHMQDVKDLILKLFIAFIIIKLIIISLIIYLGNIDSISYAFTSSLILLAIISIILYFFNFSSLFTSFHNLFFQQGTWIFSEQDLLIKLFPIQFFQDLTKNIWLNSLYQLFIVALTAIGIRKLISK